MASRRLWSWLLTLLALLLVGACAPETATETAPDSADWSAQIQERIMASGYAPQITDDGFRISNRAQGFDATFIEEGMKLASMGMSLRAWGREGSEALAQDVAVEQGECGSLLNAEGECIRRLAYHRPGITEWWENRPDGLEHGFTVDAPSGDGALVIDIGIDGAMAEVEGDDTARIGNLRYSGLVTFDETGRELPAWMEEAEGGLRLVVDDSGAVGRITVDPLLTTAAWMAESDQAGAKFGTSASSAGDVNGDGYGDVLVGAQDFGSPQTDEGRVFLYLGSASGLATTASWTVEPDQTSAHQGNAVSLAGDVNGDGYSDVVVGANQYDNGQTDEGRAWLYLGSASGLATNAIWTAESDQAYARFGTSVSSAGDVNGDGFADVVVGAYLYDNGQTNDGQAYLYLGSASGLTNVASWIASSNQASAYFGFSVSSAGDVNGDGYGDVIVGAPEYDNGQSNEGRTYLYLGSASGLDPSASWTYEPDRVSDFGQSISSAGDVNGDGYGDIVVGAYKDDNGQADEGRACLFLGSASGLAATASWTAESDQVSGFFGQSVSSAGDVNGDGFGDVVVGATGYDNGETDEGRVFLYLGSATGLANTATWTAESDQVNAYFGWSVSSAGDVNGDGLGDLAVGAYLYDNGQTDEGAAFLYFGSASILAATPTWTAESDQADAYFGTSTASAGDVNGDGYGDAIVGAYDYDNGQTDEGRVWLYLGSASGMTSIATWLAESNQANAYFGQSVSSAGDVNGDGYGDVVIGAEHYDNGQTNEGLAYLYLGSASGLPSVASWIAESDETESQFGASVSTAGDVNGDGYDDIVVGAPCYSNGLPHEGRAYLFLGSPSGLSNTAAWTVEPDVDNVAFGESVSSAGDVNGDGYGDVLVGSFISGGQTHLYLGSATGLASVASTTIWGQTGSESYGKPVSSAGDVNGDGYGDIVVGSRLFDNGQTDEGRAYLYLGSATGLVTIAAWTAESDLASAFFGYSASSAGDVNGDGHGDLVVGAYGYGNGQAGEGRSYLYLGSPSGLATTASWTAESDQANAAFGYAVSAAGDVNGDGYGDVVVGSYNYANGQTNEGRAYIFLGNGADGTGPGLALAPQARQPGTATPIVQGLTSPSNSFDVAMGTARGPWGRSMLKVQVEAKPQGTPFDGIGLLTQPSFTSSNLAGAAITQSITGLAQATGYHWRARVLVSPAQGQKQGWGSWKYGGISGNAQGAHVVTVASGTAWYADADGDGYGDPTQTVISQGQPTGYVSDATDCDDSAAAIHPGATEICDTADADDDCDGLADDPSATGQTIWYVDADSDGYGLSTSTAIACDQPPGYVSTSTDCDDSDVTINPGTAWYRDADADGHGDPTTYTPACYPPVGYVADATDCDDTNPSITWGTIWYHDADGDGHGTPDSPVQTCELPSGFAADATDCDDTNAAIHPNGVEVCDEANADEDCDGMADDLDTGATGLLTWFHDADGDSYGNPLTTTTACDLPPGYASNATDCDDIRPEVHPAATELCNLLDDDCDGFADGPDAADALIWYLDADSDGYGLDASTELACGQPTGFAPAGGDCNDANTAMHPNAIESDCKDPIDYNCDGSTGYTDADADSFAACVDCDDQDAAINPDATETCNAVDDDCSGSVDDNATDAMTWYPDADVDFYGSAAEATVTCIAPSGTILSSKSLGDDCDDENPAIHPGANEVCGGVDDDCDGTVDEAGATGEATWYHDEDQDGFADLQDTAIACTPPDDYIAASKVWDCDDSNAAVNPDETEICNTIDDDCDGYADEDLATLWYADMDGDGYGDAANTLADCAQPEGYVADATDCDDANNSIYPGADEIPGDGIDQDCDGVDLRLDSGDTAPIVDSGPEATDSGGAKTGGCGGCASTGVSQGGWIFIVLVPLARRKRLRAPKPRAFMG